MRTRRMTAFAATLTIRCAAPSSIGRAPQGPTLAIDRAEAVIGWLGWSASTASA